MADRPLDLQFHFEPIVRLDDDVCIAHELLLRAIGGGELRARAVEADVDMAWITWLALHTAGAVLETALVPLHVNITPADLARPSFAEEVHRSVRAADLPWLVLEVTEDEPFTRCLQVRENVIELRRAGVRFAVDDLLDGWAGTERVEILEPDVIKIRLEHLRATEGPAVAAMLRGRAARGTGVVVEQVEDDADRDLVRDLGLPFGQGWRWPAAADAAAAAGAVATGPRRGGR